MDPVVIAAADVVADSAESEDESSDEHAVPPNKASAPTPSTAAAILALVLTVFLLS